MPVRFRPPPLLSSKFFYLYLYPAIVFSMTDINDMLNEAEHGKKGNYVEGKITPEAEPFWIALKNRGM